MEKPAFVDRFVRGKKPGSVEMASGPGQTVGTEAREVKERGEQIILKEGQDKRNAVRVLQAATEELEMAVSEGRAMMPVALKERFPRVPIADIYMSAIDTEAGKKVERDKTVLDGVGQASTMGYFAELFNRHAEHVGTRVLGQVRAMIFAGTFKGATLEAVRKFAKTDKPTSFWRNVLEEGGHGIEGPDGVHSLEVGVVDPESTIGRGEELKRKALGDCYLEFLQNQLTVEQAKRRIGVDGIERINNLRFNLSLLTSSVEVLAIQLDLEKKKEKIDERKVKLLEKRTEDLTQHPDTAIKFSLPDARTPHTHDWGEYLSSQEIVSKSSQPKEGKRWIKFQSDNPALQVIDAENQTFFYTDLMGYVVGDAEVRKSAVFKLKRFEGPTHTNNMSLFSITEVPTEVRGRERKNNWGSVHEARHTLRYKEVRANKGAFGYSLEVEVGKRGEHLSVTVAAAHVNAELQESRVMAQRVAEVYKNPDVVLAPVLPLEKGGYKYGVEIMPPREHHLSTSGVFYEGQKPGEPTAEQLAHEVINASNVVVDVVPVQLKIPIRGKDGEIAYVSAIKAGKYITEGLQPGPDEREAIVDRLLEVAVEKGGLVYDGRTINLDRVIPNSPEARVLAKLRTTIAETIFPSYLSVQSLTDATQSTGERAFVCKSMTPNILGETPTRLSLFVGGKTPDLLAEVAETLAGNGSPTEKDIVDACDEVLRTTHKESARRRSVRHIGLFAQAAEAASDPMSSFLSGIGAAAGENGRVLRTVLEKLAVVDPTLSKPVNEASLQISSAGVARRGIRKFVTAGTAQMKIDTAVSMINDERVFRTKVKPEEVVTTIFEMAADADYLKTKQGQLVRMLLGGRKAEDQLEVLKAFSVTEFAKTNLGGEMRMEIQRRLVEKRVTEAIRFSALEQAVAYINLRLVRPDLTPV